MSDLKRRIVELGAPTSLRADCMRLRLIQTGGKLGAVLVDGVSLSDAVPKGRLSDGLKLAVTPTQEPEQFTAAHRLVRVQRWIPATMRLVPNPREIAVEEAVTTVSELQQTLARFVGDEFGKDPGSEVAHPSPGLRRENFEGYDRVIGFFEVA